MMSWIVVFGLAAAAVTIGAWFDKVLVDRQRHRLYARLERWWIKLADTPVPRFAEASAMKVRGLLRPILRLRRRDRFRSVAIVVVVSWVMTTVAWYVGTLRDPNAIFSLRLPWWPIYAANLPFDVATIAVTYVILNYVRHGRPLRSVAALAADALAATVFAFGSLYLITSFTFLSLALGLPFAPYAASFVEDPVKEAFPDAASVEILEIRPAIQPLAWGRVAFHAGVAALGADRIRTADDGQLLHVEVDVDGVVTNVDLSAGWAMDFGTVTMAATTLVPTVLFILTLFVLLAAKFTLIIARTIALQLLEAATHPDMREHPERFIPGTLVGGTLGVAGLVAKAIGYVLKSLAG